MYVIRSVNILRHKLGDVSYQFLNILIVPMKWQFLFALSYLSHNLFTNKL